MKAKLSSAPRSPAASSAVKNGKPNGRSASRRAREDAADPRSRQLLAAMVAFRDGDFSVRLPADWDGIDGRIAEAFNQAIGL